MGEFWGKIITLKDDFYIVQGSRNDGCVQTIYSVNGNDWCLLEDATEDKKFITEEVRLACTIDNISRDAMIKPKIVDLNLVNLHKVSNFTGYSVTEAMDIKNWHSQSYGPGHLEKFQWIIHQEKKNATNIVVFKNLY